MKSLQTVSWDTEATRQFANTLVSIDSAQDMKNFLSDVMTEKEIIEISSRLEAARLLKAGVKYTDITKETKLSSRTVARISDWMKNGYNGYDYVLVNNYKHHHSHTSPARSD